MDTSRFGYLIEGKVEQDLATGALTIRTEKDGNAVSFDPVSALRSYRGKEVRLILVSFEDLEYVTTLVEGKS